MKTITKTILLSLVAFVCSLSATFAQSDASYKIHKYNSNDGGILVDISANGKWAVIQLGTTSGGGSATPKLYNVETEEVIPVQYAGRTFEISSVSDDGNVIVGSYYGRPAALNRQTNQITIFPLRDLWQYGHLSHVTPDGKWAVGSYNGYNGKISENDELNHDYYYSTLLVNVETGDTIATPNLPKKDMAHLDQHAIMFNRITPDGRYAVGMMSWYIMQPNSAVVFVYDTQNHTYRVVGFTESDKSAWKPMVENLHHLEGPTTSADGHWLTGMAYMARVQEGSEFFSESGAPFRYDIYADKFEVLESIDVNVMSCSIDNNGTIFANPDTGSPLRDFRVIYQDKYSISLNQICKQQFGFNFNERTGYDRTGTVVAVSGDGSRVVSFPDPLGESFIFDFGKPVEEVCSGIDLLDNYSVTPVAGSVFSHLSTVEINFGRPIQVLGTGKNVHLYKADGTKVCDGLTAGNQGLSLKSGSKSVVNAVFRTRVLEPGQTYYVTIDAGAIAVANDENRINHEIRINYVGRNNGPVSYVKAAPENHSQLRQIDASSSYVLVTFDCPVKLTDTAKAYIERVADGNRIATLTISEGNTEQTKNQVLLYPTSSVYLYDGLEYNVVIDSASVCDYAASTGSYNQRINLTYHGTYVREVSGDSVLFADDFSDPAMSYAVWLRYEGDHNVPLASMKEWSFDTDNMPWQFGMSDNTEYTNVFAGSHSLYAPSGQSDDWMMTPQILMPNDGKAVLDFDAQSYQPNKKDVLKVYVFEEEFEIPYLSDAWMEDVREKSVLLDSITLTSGATSEKTEGEWTHYHYDLSAWAGKNIYVAFVNQNNNQSAIFVDNVVVQRELLYSLAFSNPDRIVAQDSVVIAGQFTLRTDQPFHSISLSLCNAAGEEVSNVTWPSITGNIKDRAIPFNFPQALPLKVGSDNKYSISVMLDDRNEVYNGSILNLAFETTKHVVLEEMTGIDCPNCPQGILSIQKCEKAFGEQFIPVSIHTYNSDPYAGTFLSYSSFLGLVGAPSARINRVQGIYYPMKSVSGTYYDTDPSDPLWYDVVARELSKLAPADVAVTANLSDDNKTLDYNISLRYALDADNQQLSVLLLVLENGLINYQANNLGTLSQSIFGEWGLGGINSAVNQNGYAYPVIHNDVVRSMVGQSMSGTLGLFPSAFEAGKTYSASLSSTFPGSIIDYRNASVVAVLIDPQTGEIINAAKTNVTKDAENSISNVTDDRLTSDIYTMSGVLVRKSASQSDLRSLPAGLYIFGGKKILVK